MRDAWRHGADAITLDLDDSSGAARAAGIGDAIAQTAQGGAEVFVRVNRSRVREDLEAWVRPGLRGIMLPQTESAADVADAAEVVAALERERGIAPGSVCLIAILASARAVWDVRAIVNASPRLSQIGLDESALARALGFTPDPQYDPFVFARGRLIVEAIAAHVHPIGIAYPLSVEPLAASYDEVHTAATTGRNLGLKGVVCPHPEWVAPVNAAFTPTAELVAYNRRVREAFAAGVAAGTAAVPLDGRMIDVPVDEWAIVVIATAEACAARDAEKNAALSRAPPPSASVAQREPPAKGP